jgi:hypothetical protein
LAALKFVLGFESIQTQRRRGERVLSLSRKAVVNSCWVSERLNPAKKRRERVYYNHGKTVLSFTPGL